MALLAKGRPNVKQIETNAPDLEENGIKFTDHTKSKSIQLFCYGRHPARAGDAMQLSSEYGRWCGKEDALRFLEELPERSNTIVQEKSASISYPWFTLIGASGNGTLKPLSLDSDLFEQITAKFRLPDRVRETILSIHGVFVKFVEDEEEIRCNGQDVSTKTLLLIFSTPKSPVREVFLTMRVQVVHGRCTVTCLLFDGEHDDLCRIAKLIMNSVTETDWKNPLAFLSMLVKDIGRSSERVRCGLDDKILKAELETGSTSWGGRENPIVRWPDDAYQTMSGLHICHNNLVFLARAVEMEIDTWTQLQRMAEQEDLKLLFQTQAPKGIENRVRNTMEFEVAHTTSRRSQIQGLRERVEVQINLINNMMAHQEASQTNLIAIIALIFAPASFTASIFGAGLFKTDDRSWIAYTASTLPVTFATVAVGLIFLEKYRIKRTWRGVTDLVRSRRQPLVQSGV